MERSVLSYHTFDILLYFSISLPHLQRATSNSRSYQEVLRLRRMYQIRRQCLKSNLFY